jgi:FkbM family methyltransferase
LSHKPTIAPDRQRSRVPLPPMFEAAARVCFAYARNQYGLRDKRPVGVWLKRTLDFLSLADKQPEVEAQMGSLKVLVSTADRTIARSVFTSGDWDPLLVGTVFSALAELGISYRGSTFLEVGANFGVYALPAVAEHGFGRAIAYEPDPASFNLLERNIARNGLNERVAAYNAALSSAPGELTLRLGSFNAGDNRIVGSAKSAGASDHRSSTVRVPARTLDGEVAAGRIVPTELGLIWLDVQGHEFEVLAGGLSVLESPAALVVEYSTAMMDDESRRGLEGLIARHYDVMVDLGWSSLTGKVRFQPASTVTELAADGRAVETDLLLVHLPR